MHGVTIHKEELQQQEVLKTMTSVKLSLCLAAGCTTETLFLSKVMFYMLLAA